LTPRAGALIEQEHDPEKRERFSDKIMLKQSAGIGKDLRPP